MNQSNPWPAGRIETGQVAERPASQVGPATSPGYRGLADLGAWLAKGKAGVCDVLVQDDPSLDAVESHLARVARRLGRRVVCADTRWLDCGTRHWLRRLGVTSAVRDPSVAVRQLIGVAEGAIVAWVGGVPSAFDQACLSSLRFDPGGVQVVLVSVDEGTRRISDEAIVVGHDPSDLACWWGEVVEEAKGGGAPLTLGRAEAAWRGLASARGLGPGSGQAALAALCKSRTAWPRNAFVAMATAEVYELLLSEGYVAEGDGLVELGVFAGRDESTEAGSFFVPHMLQAMPDDPWVAFRAAVVLLESGEAKEAQRLFEDVTMAPLNESLRMDFWRLWAGATERLDVEVRSATAMHAAEMAIRLEDGPPAEAFSELIGGDDRGDSFEVPWILGQTQLLRPDAKAARVSLDCAVERAPDESLRWVALALRAEACLLDGDQAAAQETAQAVVGCNVPHARLLARNTLGKLILANGAAEEAETHFAQDELEAQQHGLERDRMRARVNRAVALLLQSDRDQAVSLLGEVLQASIRTGDVRARCMAHLNLGVAQQLRCEYTAAFEHFETAFDLGRRIGARIGAHSAALNLAELRAMFGMSDEAWQSLLFVRRCMPKSITPARRAECALAAARIHLDRGDTATATIEINEAIAWSGKASLQRIAGDCHRLAARIALRDGDVQLASEAIEEASGAVIDAHAESELALLRARHARATGAEALDYAMQAKACAVEASDDALLLEANVLLAQLALDRGSHKKARRHLSDAALIRDGVAQRVPESIRRSYLNRPESRALDELSVLCQQSTVDDSLPSPSRQRPKENARRFLGEHPSVAGLLAKTRRVAKSDAPVLIRGESGTGKELIAELLHSASDRRDGPFVVVNCAALVETLLLSELFGHERGAFTGAVGRKRGRFEVADGGTLFLDEIGDISSGAQVALLRVLQSHTFNRVGGTATLKTDVRVVCATHRDLDALVVRGEFRQDLYYRLCGIPLDVPPLRKRGSDVVRLAQHVLDSIHAPGVGTPRRLSVGAKRALSSHSWPGNVRELENVIRAVAILTDGETIDEVDLLEHLHPASTRQAATEVSSEAASSTEDFVRNAYRVMRYMNVPLPDLKRRIEEGCVALALDDADGQITRAASYLGMKRPRVSQLVKGYGLKLDDKDQ